MKRPSGLTYKYGSLFTASNGKTDKRALRALAEDQGVKSHASEPAPAVPRAALSTISQNKPHHPKSQDLIFTPYHIPHHVSLTVSSWTTRDTDSQMADPLWTFLIQQPPIAPRAFQRIFVPYTPASSSPSRLFFSGSDNNSATSHDSHVPSLESAETKVNEISIQDITSPELAEKGQADEGVGWEGYLDQELPPQTHGNTLSVLRHAVFSLYRRLFGVVLVTNLAVLIATLIKGHTNALNLGQIVIANFFVSILMRQDYVVNAFFNVFCSGEHFCGGFCEILLKIKTFPVPARRALCTRPIILASADSQIFSWPLSIRRICARVYHIGGCEYKIPRLIAGIDETCSV